MDKIAMYRDAIFEEALNKIAKEKKEQRPNMFNSGKMVYKESLKDYNKKDRFKDAAKTFGAGLVGASLGGKLGSKVGNKVSNKLVAKGELVNAIIAGGAGSALGTIAGQEVAMAPFKKKQKAKVNVAEENATKRLADKLYGDNEKIKSIATKKPGKIIGSHAQNLYKAERAYKKEQKNK